MFKLASLQKSNIMRGAGKKVQYLGDVSRKRRLKKQTICQICHSWGAYLNSLDRMMSELVLMVTSSDAREEENALRAGYLMLGDDTNSGVPNTRYADNIKKNIPPNVNERMNVFVSVIELNQMGCYFKTNFILV